MRNLKNIALAAVSALAIAAAVAAPAAKAGPIVTLGANIVAAELAQLNQGADQLVNQKVVTTSVTGVGTDKIVGAVLGNTGSFKLDTTVMSPCGCAADYDLNGNLGLLSVTQTNYVGLQSVTQDVTAAAGNHLNTDVTGAAIGNSFSYDSKAVIGVIGGL